LLLKDEQAAEICKSQSRYWGNLEPNASAVMLPVTCIKKI
jgi:hypothetical protein